MSASARGRADYLRSVLNYSKRLTGLDSAKIFILPTWFSVVFNVPVLFLLIASFPLRSVPLLALGIFIVFIQLLSMVESHVNLRGLEILPSRDILVEASSKAVLTLQISSLEQSLGLNLRLLTDSEHSLDDQGKLRARHIRRLIFEELKVSLWRSLRKRETDAASFLKVDREAQTLQLSLPAGPRGFNRLPPILVYSYFPFGLFRAVKIIELSDSYLAYPAPKGPSIWGLVATKEIASAVIDASKSRLILGSDEYDHHRPFRFGDPLRRVDWRASSRRGSTVVRVFDTPISNRMNVLRWQDTTSKDVEGKLSELAFGILEAARAGEDYAMELPQIKTKVGHGERHKIDCLRILASFGSSDGSRGGISG
jgi:uncharacterized protein (DUF58 family)